MAKTFYRDADGDGHGTASERALCENGHIPSGYVIDSDDCDDSDPTKFRRYNHDAQIGRAIDCMLAL